MLAPPPRPSPAASQPRGSLLPPEPCVCVRGWAAQRSVHPQPRPPSAPRGITGVVVLLRPSSGGGKRHADYTSQRVSRAAKEPMGARDGRRPGYIKHRPTRRALASPGSAERSSAAAEERCGAERSGARCGVRCAQRAEPERSVRAGLCSALQLRGCSRVPFRAGGAVMRGSPGGCGVAAGPALRYCPRWEAGVGRRPGAAFVSTVLRAHLPPPHTVLR